VDVAAIVMRGRDTRKRRGGDGKEKPMPSFWRRRGNVEVAAIVLQGTPGTEGR
jgi:hypothetical protein